MSNKKHHVGFITLIGRPNAGKSTFVNTLIGEKVSIVSKTPQTTQRPVRGIYTDEQMQVIFLDVPGFHQSVRDWNQQLNDVVLRSLEESDGILRLIDASRSAGKEEQLIDELLEKVNKPVITVYSKIDTVDGRGTVHCASTIPPDAMVLSSETEEGIPEILTAIKDVLPQGELLYDEDHYTDQDIFTRVSEIVREKIFRAYRDEIPHSVYVEVYNYEDNEGLVRIEAVVHCESDSQKKIIIGSGAENLKKIGTQARKELEKLFEKKVYLGLRVKVSKGWRRDKQVTKDLLG